MHKKISIKLRCIVMIMGQMSFNVARKISGQSLDLPISLYFFYISKMLSHL